MLHFVLKFSLTSMIHRTIEISHSEQTFASLKYGLNWLGITYSWILSANKRIWLTYLWKGEFVEPQVGCLRLLQSPSNLLYLPARHSTCENTGGQTSLISVREVSMRGSPFSISSYERPYLRWQSNRIIESHLKLHVFK